MKEQEIIEGNKLIIVLLKCPFCDGEPELILRGNAFTKKRSAEIKCTNCHTLQITSAIRNSLEWCRDIAIAKWNVRTNNSQPRA